MFYKAVAILHSFAVTGPDPGAHHKAGATGLIGGGEAGKANEGFAAQWSQAAQGRSDVRSAGQ